jgi:hypothetical protein
MDESEDHLNENESSVDLNDVEEAVDDNMQEDGYEDEEEAVEESDGSVDWDNLDPALLAELAAEQ